MFLTFFPVCKLPVGVDRSRDTWGRTLSLQKKTKKNTHTQQMHIQRSNISDVCFFQHVRLGSRTAAAAGCELAEPRSSWRDVAVGTGDTKSPEESPAKAIFSHSLRADGEQLSLTYVGLPRRAQVCLFQLLRRNKKEKKQQLLQLAN